MKKTNVKLIFFKNGNLFEWLNLYPQENTL